MKILVTGGAGFIGSAVIRHLYNQTDHIIINVDKLTYAANLTSLEKIPFDTARYRFEKADIADRKAIQRIFDAHNPDMVMHLAAESHVDRSIDSSDAFIVTNINGTHTMLEVARGYYAKLEGARKDAFRFHHISTDEVFGTLGPTGFFTEETPYSPNSPYSASKAASDHLVRAWFHTYGLPVVMSNCSNNYGPYHFPEKLIPLVILNGYEGKVLPIYGAGDNVRDWLHVEDHATALYTILTKGKLGESYNVGGNCERTNLQVVESICDLLDELAPKPEPHRTQIQFVKDRPGHDQRYAIDASKMKKDLGWEPAHTFETGLRQTVEWYLNRKDWWQPIRAEKYSGDRLGLKVS